MSRVGRILCSLNMHKWSSHTQHGSGTGTARVGPAVDLTGFRLPPHQGEVEYRCHRCGKKRSPEWEMPPI